MIWRRISKPDCRAGAGVLRLTVVAGMLMGAVWSGNVAQARPPSPLGRVAELGLNELQVGRVTAHHAASDRRRAEELAAMSEAAAAFFDRELNVAFTLHLAVLAPAHWFSPFGAGESEPYGMPWSWVDEQLIAVPASLTEGPLTTGPDEASNRRRVGFVLLHELGHITSKQYFHPASNRPHSPIKWFEELLATYFAYAFVRIQDPDWAKASEAEWLSFVQTYTPPVVALDGNWGTVDGSGGAEAWARTYAWYQMRLNLRAAQLYDRHGLDFLRAANRQLDWENADQWTTNSVLTALEAISPGFQAWSEEFRLAGPAFDS